MEQGRYMLLALAAAVVGCGSARPVEYAAAVCTNWKDDVESVMTSRCSSCHSGSSPAGGYDTSSYIGVLGQRSDGTAVAVAGDAGSTLLVTIDPAQADATHQAVSDVYPVLRSWVVDCSVSFFHSSIHPGGWVDPTQADFHGKMIEDSGWSFSTCQGCHGSDFAGGKSNVSCLTCHSGPGGPTGCTTCHGQPPATGAHLTHVQGGVLGKALDCTECHKKPMVYTDVGHIFDDAGLVIPGPARVTFGALANATLGTRTAPPAFDHDSGTCSGVYCHGDTLGDTKATNTQPNWGHSGRGEAACGSCHGLPPSNHAPSWTQCSQCHAGVVGADGRIVDSARHIGGKLVLGDGSGGCSACHGSSANAAPPRDLSGNTDRSAIGVGAHQAHLGAQRLRGPLECHECHVVPASVLDPGHIDHPLPALVFPSTPAFSGLAQLDGATPTWDHAQARCSNVYCHGGGNRLATDATPGLNRAPLWTGTSDEAACGTCHGLPPRDSNHSPSLPLSACAGCHGGTVDASGQIIVVPGQPSLHINGVVDVQ
jgi:predicted CxxxxCH...CXXCH cytochrome family protein